MVKIKHSTQEGLPIDISPKAVTVFLRGKTAAGISCQLAWIDKAGTKKREALEFDSSQKYNSTWLLSGLSGIVVEVSTQAKGLPTQKIKCITELMLLQQVGFCDEKGLNNEQSCHRLRGFGSAHKINKHSKLGRLLRWNRLYTKKEFILLLLLK